MSTHTLSHHMLRRTARAKERRLEAERSRAVQMEIDRDREARAANPALPLLNPSRWKVHYRVERAERGPWRWRVVEDRS